MLHWRVTTVGLELLVRTNRKHVQNVSLFGLILYIIQSFPSDRQAIKLLVMNKTISVEDQGQNCIQFYPNPTNRAQDETIYILLTHQPSIGDLRSIRLLFDAHVTLWWWKNEKQRRWGTSSQKYKQIRKHWFNRDDISLRGLTWQRDLETMTCWKITYKCMWMHDIELVLIYKCTSQCQRWHIFLGRIH